MVSKRCELDFVHPQYETEAEGPTNGRTTNGLTLVNAQRPYWSMASKNKSKADWFLAPLVPLVSRFPKADTGPYLNPSVRTLWGQISNN